MDERRESLDLLRRELGTDNPNLRCKFESYIIDNTPGRTPTDDEFQYDQNLRLFQAEVDLRKGNVTKGLLQCAGRVNKITGDAPCRYIIGAVSAWQAALQHLFEAAKAPGKTVQVIAPANETACDNLAAGDAFDLCRNMVMTLNATTVTALTDLQELKHKLGVDVPFELPKAKGSSLRASAATTGRRHRFKGPRVLAFGTISLKQGKKGKLHLKVPSWVRRELRRTRHAGHRSIRATLTIDAEVQPGLHTLRTQRVTIRLVKRRGGRSSG